MNLTLRLPKLSEIGTLQTHQIFWVAKIKLFKLVLVPLQLHMSVSTKASRQKACQVPQMRQHAAGDLCHLGLGTKHG